MSVPVPEERKAGQIYADGSKNKSQSLYCSTKTLFHGLGSSPFAHHYKKNEKMIKIIHNV